MTTLSPELRKFLLFILFLIPWFALYQKNLFPYLAQTGFDGQVITLTEMVFIIFIAIFGKHPQITKHGLILITLVSLWHILGFLSAYLGDHPYPSSIKQIEYMVHCLFTYSTWIFLAQTNKQEKMAWFLIFTLMWVIYYILAAYHSNVNAYDTNWVQQTPFFNNIRHFGFVQIALFPFLFLPLIARKQYGFLITLALASIYWASVIWTSSRGTFIASLGVSILAIIFFKELRRNLVRITILSILIGAILALQFPSSSFSLSPFRLLFLDVPLRETEISLQSISSSRFEMWKSTLSHMWDVNPLLGIAANGYQYISPHLLVNTTQPHSGPVQLLSEFGILGFSCLLLILTVLIHQYRSQPTSRLNLISRISLTGIAIGSIVDGHFYYNFSLILVSIVLALSIASNSQENTKKGGSTLIAPITILTIIFTLLIPISKHWSTYIEQQFPLTNEEQLSKVMSYPSYYYPMQWLYSFSSDPELRSKAIHFGQKNGPNKCNFYLAEYLEIKNNNVIPDNLLQPIILNCANYALLNTGRKELISLIIKEHK